MAKVTVRMSMKGTDIKEVMDNAMDQMREAGMKNPKITEMEMYPMEDTATKQGMMRMWSCSMTIEGQAPD